MSDFRIVDLASQAAAVQRHLIGKTLDEKIAWLGERGRVGVVSSFAPSSATPLIVTYCFESAVNLRCVFAFLGDQMVIAGDNHWIPVVDLGHSE
jgi:hypothetical protein